MRLASLFVALLPLAQALNNGLGLTPQMGWNTWNHYACGINEKLIQQSAEAIVSSGLAAVGYTYVNLDDCWQVSRDASGKIVADPTAFPSGIASLAQHVHKLELKLGLYSDAGEKTCEGRPGGLGHETIDAQVYAEWKVDYLKYDNCFNNGTSPKIRYPPMRDALNKTGWPIFFSMCEWGDEFPALWAPAVGNSWRTTPDISNSWESMLFNADFNNLWHAYAGPGAWNDPDMLEVGNGNLTVTESISHFSLWAVMKAPLIIGCDVTNMDNDTVAILTNTEVIAINQDPLGVQGFKVQTSLLGAEVWSGPLSGGSSVVLLLNRGFQTQNITVDWVANSLHGAYHARDLWKQQDVGIITSYSASVPSHGSITLKLTPAHLQHHHHHPHDKQH